MGTLSFAVFGGDAESVPATTGVWSPLTFGFPVIEPVVPFRPSPAGSLPEEIFQCTGARPPVDCSWALNDVLTFAVAAPANHWSRPFGNRTQNRGSPPGTTNLTTMLA